MFFCRRYQAFQETPWLTKCFQRLAQPISKDIFCREIASNVFSTNVQIWLAFMQPKAIVTFFTYGSAARSSSKQNNTTRPANTWQVFPLSKDRRFVSGLHKVHFANGAFVVKISVLIVWRGMKLNFVSNWVKKPSEWSPLFVQTFA